MAPNKNITMCKNIDLAKVTYSAPKLMDSGAKSIFIAYDGAPLIVQTPRLACPFGIKKWSNDPKNADKVDKINLELSFKGAGEKAAIAKALEVFQALDAKLLEDALDNSMAWFKRKYTSTDVVEALYTPLVRYAKDKETGARTDKYPPTMRVTLPHVNGRVTCEVYNAAQEPIPDICAIETKGAHARAIIQCTGVWVAGGKFGCSWKVVQLCVEPTTGISGFAFLEDDNEQVPASSSDHDHDVDGGGPSRSTAHVALIANSSDDEDDDLDLPKARRVVKVVG
jgi:hypothetical protein